MNLDLFNNLINKAKENNFIQNFIKELGQYLQNNTNSNLANTSRDEISLLNQFQEENNVTSEYRDKMFIHRSNLLQDYAKQTSNDGIMYYIYDKADGNYLVSICEKNRSHEIVELSEIDLPQGAGVDSILRFQNGKYMLDKESTEYIKEEMLETFNQLLEEQTIVMAERRVEGHIYEFVESSGNSIWLIDNTHNSNNCFEEFEFEPHVFADAKEGDLFKYVNGCYQRYA